MCFSLEFNFFSPTLCPEPEPFQNLGAELISVYKGVGVVAMRVLQKTDTTSFPGFSPTHS